MEVGDHYCFYFCELAWKESQLRVLQSRVAADHPQDEPVKLCPTMAVDSATSYWDARFISTARSKRIGTCRESILEVNKARVLKLNFESAGYGMKWGTSQYRPKPQALTSHEDHEVSNRRRRVARRLSKNVGARPAKVISPDNVGALIYRNSEACQFPTAISTDSGSACAMMSAFGCYMRTRSPRKDITTLATHNAISTYAV
jgi:hypothetical protein